MQSIILITLIITMGALSLSCSGKTGNDGTPVVRVNDHDIMSEEVDLQTRLAVKEIEHQGKELPEAMLPVIRMRSSNTLIQLTLLEEAADKEGFNVTEDEIKTGMDETYKVLGSEETFLQYLDKAGIPLDYYQDQTRRGLLIDKYLASHTGDIPDIPMNEAETFYHNNVGQFKHPERVRASHILVKVDEGASPEAKLEARSKAQQIREKLLSGKDFAELARAESDCPSGERGGDLEFFGRDDMVRPFSDAAFSLRVGELSDIVETQFGYHIIKKTDQRDAGTIEFETVKEKIQGHLKQVAVNSRVQEIMEELMKNARIEYLDSSLDPENTAHSPGGNQTPPSQPGS